MSSSRFNFTSPSFDFLKKQPGSKTENDDISSTNKNNNYELSQFSTSNTFIPSNSNLSYSDPYADNVPLTNHDNNPWASSSSAGTRASAGSALNGNSTRQSLPSGAQPYPVVPEVKKVKYWPIFTIVIIIIEIGVFIGELALQGRYTGSPIATKPSFNPMIGPSSYTQIHMGARYNPCIHQIKGLTDNLTLKFPCPNSTTINTNVCSLSKLCGMGGFGLDPFQWWRFITAMFLHAGFIHIIVNLLMQFTLGFHVEREIGLIRYTIVYLACGINGFILSGNFSGNGSVSTGASGAIFGLFALQILDICFNWSEFSTPGSTLLFYLVEIIIALALGLLPGLDNFAHIGGFAMGILLGIGLLRSPSFMRSKMGQANDRYYYPHARSIKQKLTNSWMHFRSRNPFWYFWVLIRLTALIVAAAFMIILIKYFTNGGGHCSWCKYLSCIPVNGWCNVGEITTSR
ncbi:hypothetical protein V1514DRAFT_309522 [Lipomyces japonicus]|uniref:uncharacterized protein n=1 Tax=Lipomyces japonicus TaxID=56871 RepID=UPI0034CE45AC